MQQIKHISLNKFRWAALLVFILVAFWTSWQSDDAYHAYIMAKHLVEGKGFVYNVGYRVSASTCPFFTLIIAALYALFHNISAAGIFAGILFSAGAAYVIFFKFCNNIETILFAEAAMLGSYCFMCYTTAGLENSLLYFLGVLFFYIYIKTETFDAKVLFALAFLLALLAWTRMDTVLIFVPIICYGYLFKTKVPFPRRVLLGFAGLSPFILWEIFSIWYYGYPFPNTMYVKLNTGFPKQDYIARGFDFIYRSFMCDLWILLIPLVFFCLAIWKRNKEALWLAGGIFAYTVYVVWIGGDFMLGRHLTLQFILSLAGMLWLLEDSDINGLFLSGSKTGFFLSLLCAIAFLWGADIASYFSGQLFDRTMNSAITSVADEKKYYTNNLSVGSTILTLQAFFDGRNLRGEFTSSIAAEIRSAYDAGAVGYMDESLAFGMLVYDFSSIGDIYLTDPYGLMDPLLSHLPAEYHENWRTGHMLRNIPDGYAESVATGTNQLTDPGLHEYYDKILLIIQGDLWDLERLGVIWKMNTGQYDYLLTSYIASLNTENSPQ